MRTKLFAAALLTAASAAPMTFAAPSAAELEAAGNLFAITCSSSFCHGEAGVGARGPSLRNRDFPPDFVRNTMMNGRSGTPMPAFKNALTPGEINLIAAYVMSLSPENHQADTGPSTAAGPAEPPPPSEQALRGSALFFDGTRVAGCGLCHSYGDKGGLMGPDLSGVAKQAPTAIYQSIVDAKASAEGFAAVTVTAKDGTRISGIAHDRNDTQIGLFDISSAPPALRRFYIADGIKIEPVTGAALYKHDLSAYSKTELADLIAFLKSADAAAPKTVTAQDIGLQ